MSSGAQVEWPEAGTDGMVGRRDASVRIAVGGGTVRCGPGVRGVVSRGDGTAGDERVAGSGGRFLPRHDRRSRDDLWVAPVHAVPVRVTDGQRGAGGTRP